MFKKILFSCVTNTSLSQMAESLATHILGSCAEIAITGPQPIGTNPRAIAAMKDIGIDISYPQTKSIDAIDSFTADLVITLCAEDIPSTLSDNVKHLYWPIADPEAITAGLTEEKIQSRFRLARDQIKAHIEVLSGLLDLPEGPDPQEFHASIRIKSLSASVRFYAWLLNAWPKEWTHRYAIFSRPDLHLNFVLLVSDGKPLHQDTLYHLGIGMADRPAIVDTYHRAVAFGAVIEKPPRTTWKGTPLHELWLRDPDGTLIEVYARLTESELAEKPTDESPVFLVPGTAPTPADV